MKRILRFSWFGFVLLFVSTASSQVFVPESGFWEAPHRPPGQPVQRLSPLELTQSKIEVRIKDQIAATTVEQEFYNPQGRRIEGSFLFPVPKGAHLNKFTMDIDGKPVEAELLDAKKARKIYEDIVRKAEDPALLEYADRDLFRVRIFPIEAHSSRRVSFRYTQVLQAESGLVGYIHPLGSTRFSAKPVKSLSLKVEIESKRPIKTIYSPSHAVEISRPEPRKAVLGYEASDVTPDADFQVFFAAEGDEIGLNLLTHRTGKDDGYFLLFASPGIDGGKQDVLLKDIAFVLDTSGSMSGNKLEQAKKALLFCVENLNDGDRFEVIRFSTDIEPVFDGLVEASGENRKRALSFVKDLRPRGGTAIHDALLKALDLRPESSERPFYIIFLTDGQPTTGVTRPDEIVSAATKKAVRDGEALARIFCFGIGTDVNTHLLDKIAENTKAFSQYVLPEEDLEVKLSSFFARISEPVLANPEIRFPKGVRVTRMYPSPLPDLFKGGQVVLAGRYSGGGKGKVVIEGNVNGSKKSFSRQAEFPNEVSEHDFIPRLWATRRVGYLLDEIRLRGDNKELRDEVAELARKYGIVTPYTAYLILEDDDRRNVPQSVRALAPLQEGRARQEAGVAFDDFQRKQAGEAAVAATVAGAQLRTADVASPKPARTPSEGFAVRTRSSAFQESFHQAASQTQIAGARTFYLNGNQWVDSEVQRLPKARRVQIQFNSPEYFDLLAKNENVLPWVAVGRNVQFVLGNTVYEIHE